MNLHDKYESGGMHMFEQMFEAMHEMLDEIIAAYPTAVGTQKVQLQEEMQMLKSMNNTYIEQWILFEEKLEEITLQSDHPKQTYQPMNSDHNNTLDQGMGYFTLMMFEHAVERFNLVLVQDPDHAKARLYLALCYFELGEQDEAYRHFKLISSLTEDAKVKAICYHNMGCIQANMKNMEQASEYFEKALKSDPSASFYSLS